jgi:tol-pal system protein YbgF
LPPFQTSPNLPEHYNDAYLSLCYPTGACRTADSQLRLSAAVCRPDSGRGETEPAEQRPAGTLGATGASAKQSDPGRSPPARSAENHRNAAPGLGGTKGHPTRGNDGDPTGHRGRDRHGESAIIPGSPTEIYLQAFADYASGRFERAIDGFQTFLRHYPHNDYAGNAQYWLGECYYSRQEYALAVAAFRKTVESYPQGGKTPDALLKMATALQQMNEAGQAQEALRLLRSRYPDSPAARKSLESN